MKITHLYSASVLVEDHDVKILCDPWLTGTAYSGSWAIYPPYEFKPEKFDNVDFIWISHIHPDHISGETLSKLNKDIPVLIHHFPNKGLKSYIESMGFSVIELEHNLRTRLKGNLYMNILAADDCNPEICGRLMGCSVYEKTFGTMQLDTICVIDNNSQVLVNVNDCPFPIAQSISMKIKEQYLNIDLLLLGYVRASSHPQCFDFDEKKMAWEVQNKQNNMLEMAVKFIDLFKPKYYVPFAGTYTLCGKQTVLNKNRGEPDLAMAVDWFKKRMLDHPSKIIASNSDTTFDITTSKQSRPFIPVDQTKKQKYIDDVLSNIRHDYEKLELPKKENIVKLLPECYKRFEKARERYHWSSNTKVMFNIDDDEFVSISCNGNGYEIIDAECARNTRPMLMMTLNRSLLYQILQGPRKNHWANADVGSNIMYRRIPDNYERGLYYCINQFYADIYN